RYLDEHKLSYRTDLSNAERSFARNRIRHELMPILRQHNSAVSELLCKLAEQAGEAQGEVSKYAAAILKRVELPAAGNMRVFSTTQLSELTPFWRRELFRLVWTREGWPMGEMGFDEWKRLALLPDGGPPAIDLPGGISARRRERVMQLERLLQ